MNFNITTLLSNVDSFGQNFVQQAYQNLAQALTAGGHLSVAGLLLTLYVIFWGIGIWQGTASGGPSEHAVRLLRAFTIYAMATSWADFQALAYKVLNDAPSSMGNALLTVAGANATGGSANLSDINAVQNALQNLWTTTANAVSAFIKNLGVLNFGGYFVAMCVYVAVALMVAFATFLIILSKVFMWLLLAIAPLFILMLLFGATSRFFMGWLSTIIQYFFVQVLVYTFTAFFVSITQTYFDRVTQANSSFATTWAEMAPLILIAAIGILLLGQITNMAASLAGGIGIQAPTPGRFFAARGATAALFRMGQRRFHDLTGTQSRREKLAARESARMHLGRRAYQNSPEYRALEAKLMRTE